jgi:uncharacterized protein YyaL (SSP411 family)
LNTSFSSTTGGYNLISTPLLQESNRSGDRFEDAPDVPIVNLKPGSDNAIPSPNGIIATNLLLLSSYLDEPSYKAIAKKTIDAFAIEIIQHPFLFVSMLSAVVLEAVGVKSVVATGEAKVDQYSGFGRTVVRLNDKQGCEWLRGRNSVLRELKTDGEQGRVLNCEAGTCRAMKEGELDASREES